MCKCGCGTCETKITGPLLTEGKVKSLLSEGLLYHIEHKLPLFETVYRIGSGAHLSLIKEARKLYSRNIIDLCEEDEALIKTHLGEFALYEGESVPLDLPMLSEQMDLEDELANEEFGMDYDQLGSNEKEWVRDEIDNMSMREAEFRGKDVPLNKPKRGGSKAYYVYVRDPKTKKIKKVSFGSGGLRAKINNPKARNAFAKRHRCNTKNDRTKPGYWSCRLPRYAKALGLGNNKNTFW